MYTRILLLLFIPLLWSGKQDQTATVVVESTIDVVVPEPDPIIFDSLHLKDALEYCKESNFSQEFAVLINLAPHSGNYRLFGMNLLTKDTVLKGLVTHGHCQKYDGRIAEFSNEVGSNCSSLGHYKIRGKYQGSFGTSYKLSGLDASNSNAYKRFVVLHSHSCIPDEKQPDDICRSEGCPTVSPNTLLQLEKIIDSSSKPILLWIFNE